MQEYSLGLYEKAMPNLLSLREKLEIAKQSGFDFVELSIDESEEKLKRLDMTDIEICGVINAMQECGIYFRTICLSGNRKFPLGANLAQDRAKGLEIVRKAIDLAYKLGIRIIQIAGYDTYYETRTPKNEEYFAENLEICVHRAAAKGVILAFETMETDFMNTVEKAMKYVSKNNSPYLQIYPDIGNLTNSAKMYGKDVVDDIALGRGRIVAAHLKETIPNVFRDMTYGTGHTDYVSCIKELKKQSVRMFVGEFWYLGSETWKDDLKRANMFLREKIEQAFA